MASFHQRLLKARQAAGWTQQQLARQAHVSRQTVSHWETGRQLPDEETMERLRALLSQLEAETPEETQGDCGEEKKAKAPLPGWLWLLILGMVCLLLVVAVRALLLQPQEAAEGSQPVALPVAAEENQPADAPAAESTAVYPAIDSLDWYRQQPANDDPAKAYVDVVPHRTEARLANIFAGEEPSWRVGFDVVERNGISFYTDWLTITVFTPEGEKMWDDRMAGRDLVEWMDPDLTAENPYYEWQNAISDEGAGWYCLAVEGHDEAGNQLAFGNGIRLVDELQPDWEKEEFLTAGQPEAGKAFLSITAREGEKLYITRGGNPYSGEDCYLYTQLVTNTGDAALTITRYDVAYFNGDALYFQSDSAGESFMRWCGESDTILAPGETWVLESFEPVSPMDLMCFRVVGLDESGEELQFTGVIVPTGEYPAP